MTTRAISNHGELVPINTIFIKNHSECSMIFIKYSNLVKDRLKSNDEMTDLEKKNIIYRSHLDMLKTLIDMDPRGTFPNKIPGDGGKIFPLFHNSFFVSFGDCVYQVRCGDKYKVTEQDCDGKKTISTIDFFPAKYSLPAWFNFGGDSQIVFMNWYDNKLKDSTIFGAKEEYSTILGEPPLDSATGEKISIDNYFDGFKYLDSGKKSFICSTFQGGRGFGTSEFPYKLDSEPIKKKKQPIFTGLVLDSTKAKKRKLNHNKN